MLPRVASEYGHSWLVRRVHQILGNFALQTRRADVEAGREAVSAATCAQVHFGVNGHARWKSDLPFAGREAYRTEKTGRPTGGEKLFGVARRRCGKLRPPGRRWYGLWRCIILFRVSSC